MEPKQSEDRQISSGNFRVDASREGLPTYGVERNGEILPVKAAALPEVRASFDRVDSSAKLQQGDVIVVRYTGQHQGSGYAEVVTDVDVDDDGRIRSIKARGVHADGLSVKERAALFRNATYNAETQSWTREQWDARKPGPIEFFVLRPKSSAAATTRRAEAPGAEQPAEESQQRSTAPRETKGVEKTDEAAVRGNTPGQSRAAAAPSTARPSREENQRTALPAPRGDGPAAAAQTAGRTPPPSTDRPTTAERSANAGSHTARAPHSPSTPAPAGAVAKDSAAPRDAKAGASAAVTERTARGATVERDKASPPANDAKANERPTAHRDIAAAPKPPMHEPKSERATANRDVAGVTPGGRQVAAEPKTDGAGAASHRAASTAVPPGADAVTKPAATGPASVRQPEAPVESPRAPLPSVAPPAAAAAPVDRTIPLTQRPVLDIGKLQRQHDQLLVEVQRTEEQLAPTTPWIVAATTRWGRGVHDRQTSTLQSFKDAKDAQLERLKDVPVKAETLADVNQKLEEILRPHRRGTN